MEINLRFRVIFKEPIKHTQPVEVLEFCFCFFNSFPFCVIPAGCNPRSPAAMFAQWIFQMTSTSWHLSPHPLIISQKFHVCVSRDRVGWIDLLSLPTPKPHFPCLQYRQLHKQANQNQEHFLAFRKSDRLESIGCRDISWHRSSELVTQALGFALRHLKDSRENIVHTKLTE